VSERQVDKNGVITAYINDNARSESADFTSNARSRFGARDCERPGHFVDNYARSPQFYDDAGPRRSLRLCTPSTSVCTQIAQVRGHQSSDSPNSWMSRTVRPPIIAVVWTNQ
jgi:hypothetical protein